MTARCAACKAGLGMNARAPSRLLVVHHTAEVASSLVAGLSPLGFQVSVGRTVVEAFFIATREKHDAVLIEHGLVPPRDLTVLIKELRALFGEEAVVLLLGPASPELLRTVGADDAIVAPFSYSDISLAIGLRSHLRRRGEWQPPTPQRRLFSLTSPFPSSDEMPVPPGIRRMTPRVR